MASTSGCVHLARLHHHRRSVEECWIVALNYTVVFSYYQLFGIDLIPGTWAFSTLRAMWSWYQFSQVTGEKSEAWRDEMAPVQDSLADAWCGGWQSNPGRISYKVWAPVYLLGVHVLRNQESHDGMWKSSVISLLLYSNLPIPSQAQKRPRTANV